MRQQEPLNLESPLTTLDSFLTPTERFFVRSHNGVPAIDPGQWRLVVEGAVERRLELRLEELQSLPASTRPVTLECAGNGRSILEPPATGVQWGPGAVSTASWTGVPLSVVLEKAGVRSGAVEAVLEGADSGILGAKGAPAGPVPFARSLPLSKAMQPEVLLAYVMNDAPLAREHGFPLRALVPGWYAMASVKWLTRVVVLDRPFQGYYQTLDYARWVRQEGLATLQPLSSMQPKAQISHPAPEEVIPAGSVYRVRGAAWSGENPVTSVNLSTDGGETWAPARFVGEQAPFCWRLWEAEWRVPAEPGRYCLIARAADSLGSSQPGSYDRDRCGYMINTLVPVPVTVKS